MGNKTKRALTQGLGLRREGMNVKRLTHCLVHSNLSVSFWVAVEIGNHVPKHSFSKIQKQIKGKDLRIRFSLYFLENFKFCRWFYVSEGFLNNIPSAKESS